MTRPRRKHVKKLKLRWSNPVSGEREEWGLMQQRFIQCCDCGLVHMYYVEKIYKNKVIIASYRDDYLTEQTRKEKK